MVVVVFFFFRGIYNSPFHNVQTPKHTANDTLLLLATRSALKGLKLLLQRQPVEQSIRRVKIYSGYLVSTFDGHREVHKDEGDDVGDRRTTLFPFI